MRGHLRGRGSVQICAVPKAGVAAAGADAVHTVPVALRHDRQPGAARVQHSWAALAA